MLPLFFCEQGASAPNGLNGGIALRQAFPTTSGWTCTAYIGGTNLGSFTFPNKMDAVQRAMILWMGAWINTFIVDSDPDN
jgi:hypothetical protein